MKWISTTIKRKWIDKILSGEKTTEYKGYTDHWKRLEKFLGWHIDNDLGINFLCGRVSYKYYVLRVTLIHNPRGFDIDGVKYYKYFEIDLGTLITCYDCLYQISDIGCELDMTIIPDELENVCSNFQSIM